MTATRSGIFLLVLGLFGQPFSAGAEQSGSHFAGIPINRPTDRPLSAATARLYAPWNPPGDFGNEFHTTLKYSRIRGIGKDPEVSRRDPSKVIRVGGTYYVWYTRRKTAHAPVGLQNYTDETPDDVPAWDWDLAVLVQRVYRTHMGGSTWRCYRPIGA